MKPLLLSKDASFVLIAGKDVEQYLGNKEDSVFSSLFTRKMYVPLNTPEKMEILWKKIYEPDVTTDKIAM